MAPSNLMMKGLVCVGLLCLCSGFTIKRMPKGRSFAIDADGVVRRDIPFVNRGLKTPVVQGDIALPPGQKALVDPAYRWTFPIPYILADSLDLNAKGVIHQAFEMYRLKTCVDFKPYEGEKSYIKFEKLDGCWSMVGNLGTGQQLSLGQNCDYKGTIMHEILHALGFYHEQSRTDRDDYIDIWWDAILPGMDYNFDKYTDDFISAQNTPYDYESIMHYGPYSFNNGQDPTMTAKDPEMTKYLGQYNDFSSIDLLRVNKMYNCSSSLTLLDQCTFESINTCGMIQSHTPDASWLRTTSVPGESHDHTLLGQCTGVGHFMYFRTDSGQVENSAFLESRVLYPKRKQQCLQFYYKMTGGTKDRLVVWTRREDAKGKVLSPVAAGTFAGGDDHSWNIAHVPLNMDGKFRYAFQGLRGDPATYQTGILIDDITLAETRCPSATWRIKNFSSYMKSYAMGEYIQSPLFYSPEGYAFGIQLLPNSWQPNFIGAFLHLSTGKNDQTLQWPAGHRQVTVTVLDQNPDVRQRQSFSMSYTTSPTHLVSGTNNLFWDNPAKVGWYDSLCDCYYGPTWGWNAFFSHYELHRRDYLKNDDLILHIEFEDLTPLIRTEVPVKPEMVQNIPN